MVLQIVWLRTTEIYSLAIVKVISLKSRCQQGHTLSEGSRGESVICLSFSFWGWPGILGIPWFLEASLQSLSPYSHGILPMCLSLCFASLLLLF